MRAIRKPVQEPLSVYQLCINSISNKEVSGRLAHVSNDIELAAANYDLMASKQMLYTISSTSCKENEIALGNVTRKELNDTYSIHLSRSGKPARRIYDELRFGLNQLCPFCGFSQVATLDHYLAKSKYPQFSVLPSNLVPACSDCNTGKGAKIIATAEEQVLHPYFDHEKFIDEQWLYAEVRQTSPVATVRFFVESPDEWDNISKARVKSHFKEFNLSRRYSIQAADEIVNIGGLLSNLCGAENSSSIEHFIKIELEARAKTHAE